MTADPWLSAYGEPYDPRPAIEAWRAGDAVDGPKELQDKLCHQGAVNSASYAAVGEIARLIKEQSEPDWNAFALIASIEEGRVADGNPPVPSGLRQDYEDAWATILPIALRYLGEVGDDLLVRSTLAVIAHAKGQHTLATIALCTEDEREEMLAGQRQPTPNALPKQNIRFPPPTDVRGSGGSNDRNRSIADMQRPYVGSGMTKPISRGRTILGSLIAAIILIVLFGGFTLLAWLAGDV